MRQPSHEGSIRRADKTLIDELRAAVAAEQVLTEGDLSAWEVDWRRRYRGRALCVVRPGDTLRTEVEVVQKRMTSKPGRGLVVFRDHVYNQHDEEVFRNDKHALIRCRDSAPE